MLSYRRAIDKDGNLETTYFDNEENVAFRETLLTSDQSTLVTNDEDDEWRRRKDETRYSFKSALSNNINDYIEVLDDEDECKPTIKSNNTNSDTLINHESTLCQNQSNFKIRKNRFIYKTSFSTYDKAEN